MKFAFGLFLCVLHSFVDGAGDYFVLLFFAELVEVDRISAYTDCKRRIFFGVFLCVEKHFTVEYVYVKMIPAGMDISVYHRRKVFYAFFFRRTERGGRCAERVGNSVDYFFE